MAEMTVVTYGGGEILYNIFNAIAMLMNGEWGLRRGSGRQQEDLLLE